MSDGYDCVVPAAGESSRMGEWKLMMRIGSETVTERCVRNALDFCTRVILVTGYRGEELRSLFEGRHSVTVVENKDYLQGMFSSIRTGVRFVRTRRFFVALADMPFVPSTVFRALAELAVETPLTDSAVRPFYRGIPGHPVLLSSTAIDKILQFDNSHTMQEVLRQLRLSKFDTEEEGAVSDIDTPEDSRRFGVGP